MKCQDKRGSDFQAPMTVRDAWLAPSVVFSSQEWRRPGVPIVSHSGPAARPVIASIASQPQLASYIGFQSGCLTLTPSCQPWLSFAMN